MFHPTNAVVVSALLKEATADSHASTEKKLIRYIKSIESVPGYAALLQALYGYYAPLEAVIETFITTDHLPDLLERRKASLALNDLNVLGISSVPQPSSFLPQIRNEAAAWGSLYVLEGSTLGGKHIAALLSKKMADIHPDALSFFEGYGPDGMEKWEIFKAALNKRAKYVPADELITAAENTFTQLGNWIDTRLC